MKSYPIFMAVVIYFLYDLTDGSLGNLPSTSMKEVDQNADSNPPLKREWVTVVTPGELPRTASSKMKGLADQETFKLMSYNILHDRHAKPINFNYASASTLLWDNRKKLILEELLQYNAEVICLQEVDSKGYEEFFVPSLKGEGYAGVFYSRSRARAKRQGPQKRVNVDGCATFFKTSIFKLVQHHCVDFCKLPMLSDSHKTQDMIHRVKSKDDIAQIAMLEHLGTRARHLVANTHLSWDPDFKDVRVVQTAMLTQKLEELAEHNPSVSVIVCGDLNSRPDHGVYQYLSSGALEPNHQDFQSHDYGPFTESGIQHTLKLRSAYSERQLPFTSYKPTYKATIDHIFYSPNSLAVTRVLGMVDQGYLDKVVGFPDKHFPSDHVPILAEFQPVHL